jgi:hypothetical protein
MHSHERGAACRYLVGGEEVEDGVLVMMVVCGLRLRRCGD